MTLAEVMAAIEMAAGVAQMALKIGEDALPFIEQIITLVKGGSLTEEERAMLVAKQSELADQIANSPD